MAEGKQTILLQSSVEIDNKPHLLSLTETHIFWEYSPKYSLDSYTVISDKSAGLCKNAVHLSEVIAVTGEKHEKKKKAQYGSDASFCMEMRLLRSGGTAFSLYHVKRSANHRWRCRHVVFECKDSSLSETWVEKVRKLISLSDHKRPSRLLVFINPYGGKKKGVKIYREKVAPLFELAGITTEVIVTTRANHARDMLATYDLSQVDGLICVGGDGMYSELLNGLLDRTLHDTGQKQNLQVEPIPPKLRIGIIPAGSTDTIAFSTTGINDPVTSALHIIIGDDIAIDVCSIYQKEEFLKYSVTLIGYGYFGDLLFDSEKLRWMGPSRYNWSGFKKVLGNRYYEGEVSLLVSSNSKSHPKDGNVCYNDCTTCSSAKEYHLQNSASRDIDNRDGADGWHKVKDKFIGVNSVAMTCRTKMSPIGFSPATHLGDGCMDLMMVSRCSRVDFIRHLHRCSNTKADQFDFDFIKIYRVKEFIFHPPSVHEEAEDIDDTDTGAAKHRKLKTVKPNYSVWNIDGEVVDQPALHVKVHCQLIRLFARGVEQQPEYTLQCPSVCCTPGTPDK